MLIFAIMRSPCTNKKGKAMHDTTRRNCSGKPVARFIGDMVYGIIVEKDVKLSSMPPKVPRRSTGTRSSS